MMGKIKIGDCPCEVCRAECPYGSNLSYCPACTDECDRWKEFVSNADEWVKGVKESAEVLAHLPDFYKKKGAGR